LNKKLKLFTDKVFIPKGKRYIPLLYPFWGFLNEDCGNIAYDRFKEFYSIGQTLFELVSPQEADVFVFPCEWNRGFPEAKKMTELAKHHGKKVLIFFNSDSDEEILIENAIIFRTSFYASKRKQNEFALSCWSEDFLKTYSQGSIQLRDKKDIPVIGYAGYTKNFNFLNNFFSKVRTAKKMGQSYQHGAVLRNLAVKLLKNNPKIKTNFLIRNISGSAAMKYFSYKRLISFRKEFVNNILESDYTLVIRGGGNFSYRLYEVLSCGRIPLFVNTDCVLPYDHIIDWKKYVLWIDQQDILSMASKVVEFHSKLSNEEFHKLQHNARFLYEEWISPAGFYSKINKCLNV
jgi:hypothetical protein